jgi:phospholipase C
MDTIYRAVTTSPNWPTTVLVFNYDEWGGFYDHVAPGTAPIPPADQLAGNQDGRRGFRLPCVVVSPWARRGYVAKNVYDHTSVLRMIEARWSLPPLTIRDQTANNLADVLDFTKTNLHAPQYNVPAAVGAPCGTPSPSAEDWSGLLTLARSSGWPV